MLRVMTNNFCMFNYIIIFVITLSIMYMHVMLGCQSRPDGKPQLLLISQVLKFIRPMYCIFYFGCQMLNKTYNNIVHVCRSVFQHWRNYLLRVRICTQATL